MVVLLATGGDTASVLAAENKPRLHEAGNDGDALGLSELLMASNWKIGGDVGIAAGPWGREGSASTDWKMNTGILTYSKAKGAFIGATLNGANVHVDEKAMRAFYGHSNPGFRDVLTGKVPPPPQARQFLSSVRQDFHEANANK